MYGYEFMTVSLLQISVQNLEPIKCFLFKKKKERKKEWWQKNSFLNSIPHLVSKDLYRRLALIQLQGKISS